MSMYQVTNFEQKGLYTNNEYRNSSKIIVLEDAIKHNVSVIRSKTNARIIAVIKENGYGTGLLNEYQILRSCEIDMFSVATSRDALTLRDNGAEDDLLVMTPVYDEDELTELVLENIIVTIENLKQIDTLRKIFLKTHIMPRVHIKIDTGMGRYGFYYSSIPDLSYVKTFLSIEGCFTHLAGGRNYKRSTRNQIERFNKAIAIIHSMGINPKYMHVANSRALVTFGDLGFNAVRIGSLLLGRTGLKSEYKDAIWFQASVFEIVEKPKGASISYGSEITLKTNSRLAIIKAGIGDGVGVSISKNDTSVWHIILDALINIKHRSSRKLFVRIRGRKYEVLGRPGFAHMIVDIGNDSIKEGDKVMIRVNPLLINSDIERVVITGNSLAILA